MSQAESGAVAGGSRPWRRSGQAGRWLLAPLLALAVACATVPESGPPPGPPVDSGATRQSDLVDLVAFLAGEEPPLRFDIRYATANNFVGQPVYPAPRAFLQRDAATALQRAHRALVARASR